MLELFFIIVFFIISIVLFFFGRSVGKDPNMKYASNNIKLMSYVTAAITSVVLLSFCYETVPVGHTKVASLFGKVVQRPYSEGLHFPVNPLYDWQKFDLRQKTLTVQNVGIPSEDKLITNMDVSVKYRFIGSSTPDVLRNTGNADSVIEVHLIPKLRSILREQGKGVAQAQDFFKESTQRSLQVSLQVGLSGYLTRHGLEIDSVLIRDVVLPVVIRDAIKETKKREQEVLKQKAELERYATEQDQIIKKAESELAAAELEAKKIRELADAEAYQIDVINRQLAESPNYIELKRVEQWNGVLPVYAGGDNIPMIDLRKGE